MNTHVQGWKTNVFLPGKKPLFQEAFAAAYSLKPIPDCHLYEIPQLNFPAQEEQILQGDIHDPG